ncbi:MAG: DUF4097 family beta strand repeat protein [Phycisphaeraceae bacterium]|nr:DUF4097 family beta strand repeat protein [Phycisphaeraceae bacterium]
MRSLFIMLGLLAQFGVLGGCVTTDADGPMSQRQAVMRVPFAGDRAVTVEGDNGDIAVRRGEAQEAVITADIRARTARRGESVRIVAQTSPEGDLSVRVQWPIGWREAGEAASLIVELPACAALTVHTGNGSIAVEGLSGEARIDSGNGEVSLKGHQGDAEISTRNGSVELIDHRGACRVRTSNGPVDLRGVTGRVQVVTANGPIEVALSDDNPGPVDIRTTNGSVHLEVGPGFRGETRAESFNGRVRVRVLTGAIEMDDEREWAVVRREGSEPRSRVRTTNGRIDLRERAVQEN